MCYIYDILFNYQYHKVMAKISVTLQIPLDVLVKGSKEEYIKEVVKSAENKYKSYRKTYSKTNIG